MRLIRLPDILRMFAPMIGRLPAGHLAYLFRRMFNEKPHRFAGTVRINTFFPPWPGPAFGRFVQAVIESSIPRPLFEPEPQSRRQTEGQARVPFSTYLAVTSECPFRCGHCSYGRRPGQRLSHEQALGLIGQIKALGTCTLGLTGGEPLLRDDLGELLAAAKPEMATIVFTTGHGLDAGKARALRQAGLDCLTVGIESANAQAHDAVRGQAGSFAQAAEAVRISQDAGLYTAISTIGTQEKVRSGELERMFELAAQWGVGEFRLLSPVATGSAAGQTQFMVTPQLRRQLADFHVRHNRRRGGPAVAAFAYLESAEMFGCGAGYHHLFIDAAGEVCPCDLTPLSFGNALHEDLAAIWGRMGEFFHQPRRACIMQALAGQLGADAVLPTPRSQSEALCRGCREASALPEVYRRLLGRRDGLVASSPPSGHIPSSTSSVAATPTRKHSA